MRQPSEGEWVTWGNDPCTALLLSKMADEVTSYEEFATKDEKRAVEAFLAGDDSQARSCRRTSEYMSAMANTTRTWIDMINQRVAAAGKIVAEES